MKRIAGLTTCLLLTFIGSFLSAETADKNIDAHIYWIKVTRTNRKTVELTGFKVKGKNGIYTALHGVVGSSQIKGFTPAVKSNPTYNLEVSEVDVDRDIAYLLPRDEKQKLASGGLALGVAPDLAEFGGKSVEVIGYPMGINLLASSTSLKVRKPALEELQRITNAGARKNLAVRNSPALITKVLSVDGNLLPGHSGAPILDEDQSVIAVGNGGLDVGRIGWGWAIPFHEIQLVPIKNNPTLKQRLDQLATDETQLAFSCILDEEAREKLAEVRTKIQSRIASTDGGPVMAFPTTPKQAMKAQVDRLKEALTLFQQGKGDQLDPVAELNRLNKKFDPIPDGTAVEVLEIEQRQEGAPVAPAFPTFTFPGAGKGDPLQELGNVLGDAAQQINVRVKVLEGPQKGKLLWVSRNVIRRETELKQR